MPATLPYELSIQGLEKLFNANPNRSLRLFLIKPKAGIKLHTNSIRKALIWHYTAEQAITEACSLNWLDKNNQELGSQDLVSKEILPPSLPKIEEAF
jgi:hypothetical protein